MCLNRRTLQKEFEEVAYSHHHVFYKEVWQESTEVLTYCSTISSVIAYSMQRQRKRKDVQSSAQLPGKARSSVQQNRKSKTGSPIAHTFLRHERAAAMRQKYKNANTRFSMKTKMKGYIHYYMINCLHITNANI